MKRSDPYRLLGLDPGASAEQVRAAFREKVRQKHPDTGAKTDEGPSVQQIIEAYRLLMDPDLRAGHDSSRSDSGSRLQGHRVRVRQKEASEHAKTAGICSACGGSGELRQEEICPECRGRAEITVLDGQRGRVVRCPRCSGRGTVVSRQRCPSCAGVGRS